MPTLVKALLGILALLLRMVFKTQKRRRRPKSRWKKRAKELEERYRASLPKAREEALQRPIHDPQSHRPRTQREAEKRVVHERQPILVPPTRPEPVEQLVTPVPLEIPGVEIRDPSATDRKTPAPEAVPPPPVSPPPGPPPEEPVSRSPALQPDPTLLPEELADELFGDGAPGFEIKRRFEEQFEGCDVTWSGRLVRSSSYHTDTVYGRGPAVRAHFEICEILDNLGTARQVEAVVSLPLELDEVLRDERDQTFRFSGRVIQVDVYQRRLFLGQARLEDAD